MLDDQTKGERKENDKNCQVNQFKSMDFPRDREKKIPKVALKMLLPEPEMVGLEGEQTGLSRRLPHKLRRSCLLKEVGLLHSVTVGGAQYLPPRYSVQRVESGNFTAEKPQGAMALNVRYAIYGNALYYCCNFYVIRTLFQY